MSNPESIAIVCRSAISNTSNIHGHGEEKVQARDRTISWQGPRGLWRAWLTGQRGKLLIHKDIPSYTNCIRLIGPSQERARLCGVQQPRVKLRPDCKRATSLYHQHCYQFSARANLSAKQINPFCPSCNSELREAPLNTHVQCSQQRYFVLDKSCKRSPDSWPEFHTLILHLWCLCLQLFGVASPGCISICMVPQLRAV